MLGMLFCALSGRGASVPGPQDEGAGQCDRLVRGGKLESKTLGSQGVGILLVLLRLCDRLLPGLLLRAVVRRRPFGLVVVGSKHRLGQVGEIHLV